MAQVRPPRVGFSAEATHKPPLLQAHGPYLSPCLTSLCNLTPVIMPGMHELNQPESLSGSKRELGSDGGTVHLG